jgi:siderophore synthetase component
MDAIETQMVEAGSEGYTIAVQAAVTRLINTYLRETEQALDEASLFADLQNRQRVRALKLPNTARSLLITFLYYSEAGHHRFEFPLYEKTAQSLDTITEMEAVSLILREVAAMDKERDTVDYRLQEMKAQVLNSIVNTARFNEPSTRLTSPVWEAAPFLRSEQSLLFGHPFHPTPKSADGFSEEDSERYAPEMRASFALHYWAVPEEAATSSWLDLPEGREMEAWWKDHERQLLQYYFESVENLESVQGLEDIEGAGGKNAAGQNYRLLPLHPWQASYLLKRPEVRSRMDSGEWKDLGQCGPLFYPTSSVRTMWSPEARCFYKLPIQVGITNYVRTNNQEQLRRSMDAARLWSKCAPQIVSDSFDVLNEYGFVSLQDEALGACCAVLFRENRPMFAEEANWQVVAALLEDEGGDTEALATASRSPVEWIRAYTETVLEPVLACYADYGISLEAHVQNSVILLVDGMPTRYVVRDMEGISVSRTAAERHNWIGTLVSESSPVLYDEQIAWQRLLYYTVTNHMGHTVAVVARLSGLEERSLWREVVAALEAAALRRTAAFGRSLKRLLSEEGLPAKTNLLSRFRQQGEVPGYVAIRNPLRREGNLGD